jgi:hypothetical protein
MSFSYQRREHIAPWANMPAANPVLRYLHFSALPAEAMRHMPPTFKNTKRFGHARKQQDLALLGLLQ